MLALALLRCLKVISRKVANRQTIEYQDVQTVVKYLRRPLMPAIASEAASVVLNICYEKPNVLMTIDSGAVAALTPMVQDADEDVQANAAGQSFFVVVITRLCSRQDIATRASVLHIIPVAHDHATACILSVPHIA
eukprot:1807796-Rhodomonas_salina.3